MARFGAIQGKELRPPLHFSVVAIEKEAFWSLSTKVANFTTITEIVVKNYTIAWKLFVLHWNNLCLITANNNS